MKHCYVNFYVNNKKADGFGCDNPMEGLTEAGNRATWHGGFDYQQARCYILDTEADKLPELQWSLDIS